MFKLLCYNKNNQINNKEDEQMSMRIYTEKCVIRGEKYRKILGFEGVLKEAELPKEYTISYPRVVLESFCGEEYLAIVDEKGRRCVMYSDHYYKEDEFQEMLTAIEKAGERLYEINKKVKELEEVWKGEETFII